MREAIFKVVLPDYSQEPTRLFHKRPIVLRVGGFKCGKKLSIVKLSVEEKVNF